jgi:hypothetical protein
MSLLSTGRKKGKGNWPEASNNKQPPHGCYAGAAAEWHHSALRYRVRVRPLSIRRRSEGNPRVWGFNTGSEQLTPAGPPYREANIHSDTLDLSQSR